MKRILTLVSLAVLGLFVSSCYDDSALWNSMKEYEDRLATLESRYETLNGEVSSLKTLVSAVQQGDYITSVVPPRASILDFSSSLFLKRLTLPVITNTFPLSSFEASTSVIKSNTIKFFNIIGFPCFLKTKDLIYL